MRLRLTDFLNNGSGLDLGHVEAVRLEFGLGEDAPAGRSAIDDIALTSN